MKSKWKWLIIFGFVLDTILFAGFIGLDMYYDKRTIYMSEDNDRDHSLIWDQITWIRNKLH